MEWWDDGDMQQWDDTMTLKDTVHNDVTMAADAARMTTGCNEVAKGHSDGYGVPRCPAVHDNSAAARQHNNSNSKRVQQRRQHTTMMAKVQDGAMMMMHGDDDDGMQRRQGAQQEGTAQ